MKLANPQRGRAKGRSIVDPARHCARPGCGKTFVVDTGRRNREYCSQSCAAKIATRSRRRRVCLGYTGYTCTQIMGRKLRCGYCREKYFELLRQEAPIEPGPKQCALPVRGGICTEIVLFQVNRAGLTVLWCPTHGERVMPVIRPGAKEYPKVKDVSRKQGVMKLARSA
jgi:hypothetical protein